MMFSNYSWLLIPEHLILTRQYHLNRHHIYIILKGRRHDAIYTLKIYKPLAPPPWALIERNHAPHITVFFYRTKHPPQSSLQFHGRRFH